MADSILFLSNTPESIAQQEAFLIAGYKVTCFVIASKQFPDSSGLSARYPTKFTFMTGQLAEFKKLVECSRFTYAICDYVREKKHLSYSKIAHDAFYRLQTIRNRPIGFPDEFTLRLETDRAFGKLYVQEICNRKRIHSIVADVAFETANKEELIVQCETTYRNQSVVLKGYHNTEVFSEGRDCAYFLKTTKEKLVSSMFTLEKYVDGQEIAFGFYVNTQSPSRNIHTVLINREYKYGKEGDVGHVMTGEVGTCVHVVSMHPDLLPLPIYNLIHAIVEHMYSTNVRYCGFLDINTIFSKGKFHFLEWTARFGYPTEAGLIAAYCADLGKREGCKKYTKYLLALTQRYYAPNVDSRALETSSLHNKRYVVNTLHTYGYGLHNSPSKPERIQGYKRLYTSKGPTSTAFDSVEPTCAWSVVPFSAWYNTDPQNGKNYDLYSGYGTDRQLVASVIMDDALFAQKPKLGNSPVCVTLPNEAKSWLPVLWDSVFKPHATRNLVYRTDIGA